MEILANFNVNMSFKCKYVNLNCYRILKLDSEKNMLENARSEKTMLKEYGRKC